MNSDLAPGVADRPAGTLATNRPQSQRPGAVGEGMDWSGGSQSFS